MITSRFELGPLAPIGVPFFLLMAYATYRGFRFREFRRRGEWGWHKAQPNTFDYWVGTLTNVMLLASFAFVMVVRKMSTYTATVGWTRDPSTDLAKGQYSRAHPLPSP